MVVFDDKIFKYIPCRSDRIVWRSNTNSVVSCLRSNDLILRNGDLPKDAIVVRRRVNTNDKAGSNRVNHCIPCNLVVLCNSVVANRKYSDACRLHCASNSIALYDDSLGMVDFELQVIDGIVENSNVLTWRGTLPKHN